LKLFYKDLKILKINTILKWFVIIVIFIIHFFIQHLQNKEGFGFRFLFLFFLLLSMMVQDASRMILKVDLKTVVSIIRMKKEKSS
jgi:hypothetical protein